MESTIQTIAVSIVVGMVIVGIFVLFQIPLNKRRKKALRNEETAEYKTFAEALEFLLVAAPTELPSEKRLRENNRLQLIEKIKDRMRFYDARRELDELEKRK